MTPKEKAKQLVEKMAVQIGCSDFHVPEFITGVRCADGSEAYHRILKDETDGLAKQCALIAVDEILSNDGNTQIPVRGSRSLLLVGNRHYWQQVKEEIMGLKP